MSGRSVLLLGATGLVGGECLKLLLNDQAFSRVVVLTRGKFTVSGGPVLVEHHQIDFERPETFRDFLNVDSVICALGTTIKKAGSRERFRRVDHDYPLGFAQAARQSGARTFVLVTAIGSDSRSRAFYSRVKGEVETAVAALGYPAYAVLRPSLILGPRHEFRFWERLLMITLGTLPLLVPRAYRPVRASAIARAAVAAAQLDSTTGMQVISNSQIVAG